MALRHSREVGLVAYPLGNCHADVGGVPIENLEQHAQRDESRAAPAAAAEGPHGRAIAANQSALPFQHAEYRDSADSFRPRHGARRRVEAEQYSAQTASQA